MHDPKAINPAIQPASQSIDQSNIQSFPQASKSEERGLSNPANLAFSTQPAVSSHLTQDRCKRLSVKKEKEKQNPWPLACMRNHDRDDIYREANPGRVVSSLHSYRRESRTPKPSIRLPDPTLLLPTRPSSWTSRSPRLLDPNRSAATHAT